MSTQGGAMVSRVKRMVRPWVPAGLIDLRAHLSAPARAPLSLNGSDAKRRRLQEQRGCVSAVIEAIWSLTPQQRVDEEYLASTFVPSLGLNDELLHEQPPELSAYFGRGLHLWQYPVQLAAYLAWLSRNDEKVDSYLEIGCRWGGMLVLTAEWLRMNGNPLRRIVAIDPIDRSPIIEEYFEILARQKSNGLANIEAVYVQEFSTSQPALDAVSKCRPEFVFIDGDHSLRGALEDHLLARRTAKLIVHHDIASEACPDLLFLWSSLKELESDQFECVDFIEQYPSVSGRYLGIGAMKRKGLSRAAA